MDPVRLRHVFSSRRITPLLLALAMLSAGFAGPIGAQSAAQSAARSTAQSAVQSAVQSDGPATAGLFLYPDIHRDFAVFVHAGDIWRVPTAGGSANRLTSHDGRELFPKISPDGQWIAFSGEYTGSRQIYVMPATGGTPKQLTFYIDVGEMPPRGGYDYWIQGWTPDGKILSRMNRTPWGERVGRYFLVDPAGGLETPLPIPQGGSANFSADGNHLVYTPIDREFRTWKHSLGGRAQDIWTYDLVNHKSERLTTYRGTDNFPMWVGDSIIFASDRDFTMNLFAYDLASKATRQITQFEDFDVSWPSQGPDNIVFSRGAGLFRLSLADETVSPITVTIAGTEAHTTPRFEDVSDNINGADLSPSGKRVVVDARGDLFTIPAENGPTRNLTRTQGIREIEPAWSPDGKWIAYLSDATGEYEIYLRSQDGSGEAKQLTTDGSSWRFALAWSPDSKKLAFSDRQRQLQILDIDSGQQTQVAKGFRGDLRVYRWSPDSRWLAFQRVRKDSRLDGIELYSLDQAKTFALGDGLTADREPAWSADGRYLFFLSNRDFQLSFSTFEFDYVYDRSTRIYVASLDATAPALFPLQSDEEKVSSPSPDKSKEADSDKADKKAKNSKHAKNETKAALKLDPDGFQLRTVALPGLEPGNYRNLVAADGVVYFLHGDGQGPGDLQRYDLAARQAETVTRNVFGFGLSQDAKKLLLFSRGSWKIADAKPNQDGKTLDMSGLKMKLDPRAEWLQMFEDSWRISRDWFYDPEMHGMDWPAIGDRYRQLVPLLSHRSELDYLLGELVGELAAGHTYVGQGEGDPVERVASGLLGAELEATDSGHYRFAKIFQGENWHDDYRSPLTEPGVNVAEGELLLAIDGQKVTTADNPYRFLEGKGESQVVLTVGASPETGRDVVVRPVITELNLRYIDWVKERMAMVDHLSGGRIGYIHLPDTAIDGNRMLQKLFYGQATKEALIIDDRFNGGGFIPDQMMEYFNRKTMAWWAMRDIDSMRTPGFAHNGPKAMLINAYSSSGGDALPYFFRQSGLGPLIGSRTWGGLIGLNGNPGLADGGRVQICTFRIYDENGNWMVENEGVEPDIEVFDLPEELAKGEDPSVAKAVEVLLEELDSNPPQMPTRPTPPNLSRGN